MQNVKIVDDNIQILRHFIVGNSPEVQKTVLLPTEFCLELLSNLERLAILERHLSNLVSTAYEGKNE